MFVQCPRCRSLVAVDAATGVAPDYCPYCDGPLAEAFPATAESGTEADLFVERADDAARVDTVPAPAVATDDNAATVEDASAAPASDDAALEAAPALVGGASAPTNASDADAEPSADAPAVAVKASAPTGAHDAEIEPSIGAAAVVDGASIPTDTPASGSGRSTQDDIAATSAEPASETASPPKKPKPRKKTATPSFARRTQRAAGRPTSPWLWAIAAGLGMLAGLQIVLADRAELASDARFRPAIVSLCATLGCSVPPWREPAAFAMLEREVRQHPYMPGALRVDAAFRNNARWAQPWPDLVLTLSDVDGRPLGMRTFAPKEYLGDKVTQKEIGSGQTAAVRMEVMEPAPGVVAFSFDFR